MTGGPAAFLHDPAAVFALLFAVGAAVSFINSVAGGGSVLSLPLMLWLGLPAAEANGTNRLGAWFGSLGSTAAFRRHGIFHPRLVLRTGVPGLAGSLFGALVGVFLPDAYFRPVLAAVIALIAFETARPRKMPALPGDGVPVLPAGWGPFWAYFGMGFYGGFLQAGVGLLMLYGFTRLGRMTLVQANALKVANNLFFATVSIAVFAAFGKIRWDWALVFAAGNLVGGAAGSVLQVRKGEAFIRAFVAITGAFIALKLLWEVFA